jgi:uncharacterized membrane protein YoaK (UPF0700 family)
VGYRQPALRFAAHQPADRPPASGLRWPILVAAALAFGTGAIDVTTLTKHGGVFASVITGNLMLTGLAVAHGDVRLIAHTVLAVGGFIVGVATGTRITGPRDPEGPRWPRQVTVALGVELTVLCGFAAGWELTRAAPSGQAQLGLLATAAIGMGLQSAAMRGLGVTVATTYLTGTLTGVVAGLAGSPRARSDRAGVAALAGAMGGAVCAGVLLSTGPAALPLLILVPLAAVLAAAVYHARRDVVGRPDTGLHEQPQVERPWG